MIRLAGLLLMVATLGAACLGGSTAAHSGPPANLRVHVSYFVGQHLVEPAGTPLVKHDYTLTCDPAGGTMPDPANACSALSDLARRRGGTCIGLLAVLGERSTAVLAGTFNHRRYRLSIDAGSSWCGQPRPVLHDLWVLSTFPCTVEVVRSAQKGIDTNYPVWPRWAGCTSPQT